jgi:hypothetical protein
VCIRGGIRLPPHPALGTATGQRKADGQRGQHRRTMYMEARSLVCGECEAGAQRV